MKWITRKEVEAAAIDSGRAAIECSIAHWRQLLTATKREVKAFEDWNYEVKAFEDWTYLAVGDYCALCERYRCADGGGCEICPVGKIEPCENHGSIWRNASTAFYLWVEGGIAGRQFRKKAKPMLDLLESLEETN